MGSFRNDAIRFARRPFGGSHVIFTAVWSTALGKRSEACDVSHRRNSGVMVRAALAPAAASSSACAGCFAVRAASARAASAARPSTRRSRDGIQLG